MRRKRDIGLTAALALALIIGLAAALILNAPRSAEPPALAEAYIMAASEQSGVAVGPENAAPGQLLTPTLPAYLAILIPNQSLHIVQTSSHEVVGSYVTGAYNDAVLRPSANQVLVTGLRSGPDGDAQETLDILALPTLSLLQSIVLDPRRRGYTAYFPTTMLSEDEGTLFYLTVETERDRPECASRPFAHRCDRHGIVPLPLDNLIQLSPLELPLGCGGTHLVTNGSTNATAVCSLSGDIFEIIEIDEESWALTALASVSLPPEPEGPFEGNSTRIQHAVRRHSGELSLILSDGTLVTQSGSEWAIFPSPLPEGARPLTVGSDDVFLLDDNRLAIAYAGPANYPAGRIDGIAVVNPLTGEGTIAVESLTDVASMVRLEDDAFLLLGYDGSYSVLELSGARSSPVPVDAGGVALGRGVIIE